MNSVNIKLEGFGRIGTIRADSFILNFFYKNDSLMSQSWVFDFFACIYAQNFKSIMNM